MRRLVFAVLVALLPLTGFAQQMGPLPTLERASSSLRLTNDQAVAIAVGVFGGAIVLYTAFGGVAWTLAGVASGALIGEWWHVQNAGGVGARKVGPHYAAR
ncbi:MAG: hypothetical protein WCF85_10800 [Rhodospirillaceae bacterium]